MAVGVQVFFYLFLEASQSQLYSLCNWNYNHSNVLDTVQKKAMFQTKVCTKVGNSLFLNLVMIRKWTLFPVKMVNFQNAEMKFVFSWLGFKSKDMCLHELGDNGYE